MLKPSNTSAPNKDDVDPGNVGDTTLTDAMRRWKESWDYQKNNWHERWLRDNKLYDSERYDAAYYGTTDTFVPVTFQTIETMVTALFNANLRWDFKSSDPMRQVDVEPLNALLDEYADDDGWDIKEEETYREILITGMASGIMSWEMDHLHWEPLAMQDTIVDPTIKKPEDLQEPGHYAGRRYYVRKGSLDDYEVIDTDPESKTYGEMIKRYTKTPDTSGDGKNTAEPDDKTLKEMFVGSTLTSPEENQDEIIEIWDVDKVVTIKNRTYVIEDRTNPHKYRHEMNLLAKFMKEIPDVASIGEEIEPMEIEGEDLAPTGISQEEYDKKEAEAKRKAKAMSKGVVPIFFGRNYRRTSLFFAKSEIDSIAKEQELLNDQTNEENDYIIRQLKAQKELDPEYEDWLDLIDDEYGTIYPFKPGSLVDRTVQQLPQNSFASRATIKNEIREATAISEAANGTLSDKDRTKYEVSSALGQTGERIKAKARVFAADWFYWQAWISFKLMQLYIDKPLVVEVPGSSLSQEKLQQISDTYGIDLPPGTAIFDPADYQGDDWKPRIKLEVDAQVQEQQNMQKAREGFAIVIQDPTNNLDAAKKVFYPKMFDLDQKDIDEIITPPAPMEAPLGDPNAMGGQVDPNALPIDPAALQGAIPQDAPIIPEEQGAPVV